MLPNEALAHPEFFLAQDQGRSLPRLHKPRVAVTRIKARHDIDTEGRTQRGGLEKL